MKFLRLVLSALIACLGLLLFAPDASATEGPAAAADRSPQGDAVCTRCHDETDNKPILSFYKGRHGVKADGRTPGCQSCHGPSEAHVKNAAGAATRPTPDITFGAKAKSTPQQQTAACIGCHESGKRTHWAGSQHESRDVACTSCHTNHNAGQDKVLARATQAEVCFTCHKTERAQTHRVSTHPIQAGQVGCSDCHNPHGSTGPKLLVKNTVNETCYSCHAEKRGPFLWEHPPATDDCMNCHTPHGSTNAPLLRARSPWLCQQCHGDSPPHPGNVYSGANLPGGAVANVNGTGPNNPFTGAKSTQNNPSIQLSLRGCANCHSQVHGSNHPAGNRFLR